MECYQHAGATAIATCVGCARPVCTECHETVAAYAMCSGCIASTSALLAGEPASGRQGTAAPTTDEPEDQTGLRPAALVLDPAAVTERGAAGADGSPKQSMHPGVGRRLVRGALWGPVHGQWWTVLTVVWSFMMGGGGMTVWEGVFYAFFYAFFGGLLGLIIALSNAFPQRGAIIGIVVGVLACLAEMALSHSAGALINLIFYFFTGRFIGAAIAWRVQQPLRRKTAV